MVNYCKSILNYVMRRKTRAPTLSSVLEIGMGCVVIFIRTREEDPMRKLFVALLAAAGFAAVSAHAQVGVSIGINEPGVYGQINIGGGYPPPALIYTQPVIVAPVPGVVAPPPPMYMYVPPRYQRN